MVRSCAPKRLWGNCLEHKAYIRSLAAHGMYRLGRQVPETIVSGETADVSLFAQFKWIEWVMIRNTSVTYQDGTMVLGRDLGPAINKGPAVTRKVLKENGQVVYQSTVRPLTSDETMKETRVRFSDKVSVALGEGLRFEDFANNPDLETPTHSNHADDDDGEADRVLDADNEEVDADTHHGCLRWRRCYVTDRQQIDERQSQGTETVGRWEPNWKGKLESHPRHADIRS